mmetsp:Transcript_18462/g.50699  ORF Transcript_18462/g.50699 Transcript_18462/m.50699 type:complete len:134 (-) Transcript_18462:846-1247(-)
MPWQASDVQSSKLRNAASWYQHTLLVVVVLSAAACIYQTCIQAPNGIGYLAMLRAGVLMLWFCPQAYPWQSAVWSVWCACAHHMPECRFVKPSCCYMHTQIAKALRLCGSAVRNGRSLQPSSCGWWRFSNGDV